MNARVSYYIFWSKMVSSLVEVSLLTEEVIDFNKLFSGTKEKLDQPVSSGALVGTPELANGTNSAIGAKSPGANGIKVNGFKEVDAKNNEKQSMQGLVGLSDVVARLERKFAGGMTRNSDSSDEDQELASASEDAVAKPKKKRKRERKVNKEEQQWIAEGKGFIDDTESLALIRRSRANRQVTLDHSGFYVFRGALTKDGAPTSPVEVTEETQDSAEDFEAASEKLPYFMSSSIERVRDVVKALPDAEVTLKQEFPQDLDNSLLLLEKIMRKHIENYAEDLRYLSVLSELLPIREELIQTHMHRIRLLARCKWLTTSYNKSMTDLRKLVRANLDSLDDVVCKGNPALWRDKLTVLLDGRQDIEAELDTLYSCSFTSEEANVLKSMKEVEGVGVKDEGVNGKGKGSGKGGWVDAVKKCEELVVKVEKSENDRLKETSMTCLGLLLRVKEQKKPFKWVEQEKKLLRQIGLMHRKLAIHTVKLRNLERQTMRTVKSGCRTRVSMLKHVCDIWPSKYMQPEEVAAITSNSTSRLPVDSKLIAPEDLKKESKNGATSMTQTVSPTKTKLKKTNEASDTPVQVKEEIGNSVKSLTFDEFNLDKDWNANDFPGPRLV